ncbi:hypothetical protein PLESTB_001659700 [Pleodorina starrii]|uniref:Uncharacterized protein n=1 Tax=Pleodorina starrii TaxID=330485 RepID=A0A9W6BYN9_9CHLO|nr:hypothetical protein PLESTB_001659700 [Pleodorina starrii]GLC65916.1 hypothetical protein PLESTF_000357900 [Pleodorina starrii]
MAANNGPNHAAPKFDSPACWIEFYGRRQSFIALSAAAVGMLATIVLYFQQLPVAMVLFELDRMTERREGSRSSGGSDGEGEGEAGAWERRGPPVVAMPTTVTRGSVQPRPGCGRRWSLRRRRRSGAACRRA